jgi:hypothetical protein
VAAAEKRWRRQMKAATAAAGTTAGSEGSGGVAGGGADDDMAELALVGGRHARFDRSFQNHGYRLRVNPEPWCTVDPTREPVNPKLYNLNPEP